MPKINSKFLRKLDENSPQEKEFENPSNPEVPLMQFLREDPAEDTQAVIEWLHTHDQIDLTEKCRRITPEHEATGEFLLSKDKIYYVADEPLSACFVSKVLLLSKNQFISYQMH